MTVGTCEVMNASSEFFLDSFFVGNSKNHLLFSPVEKNGIGTNTNFSVEKARSSNLLGTFVGTGLVDSCTDQGSSVFISQYLARALSLHTRVPQEISTLKKEFPADPLVDIMTCRLSRHRLMRPGTTLSFSPTSTTSNRCTSPQNEKSKSSSLSIIDGWDMEQYALSADAAFFQHLCQKYGSTSSSHTQGPSSCAVPPVGCCGVWFTAGLVPAPLVAESDREGQMCAMKKNPAEAHSPFSLALEVCVSGIGNSRAFGIKKAERENSFHPTTPKSMLSYFSYDAHKQLIPLSMDHLPTREEELRRIIFAGGVVENGKLIFEKSPSENSKEPRSCSSLTLSLSRSFGYFSWKNSYQCSPLQQKIIALPTTNIWTMTHGDALVLCNHAVFESRMEENTTVDEVSKLVAYALNRSHSPEEVAGMVCDYAIRFGASKALQVTIAVSTTNFPDAGDETYSSVPQYTEWVSPGPLYVEVCRHDVGYAKALLRDCQRCNISLPELLWERWNRVRHILSMCHSLPLASLYGKECGALQQSMEEEALLFSHPVLEKIGLSDCKKEVVMPTFVSLARSLLPDTLDVTF